MSINQEIQELTTDIQGLHKKYSDYFTNHYYINAIFSDYLATYENTILQCGFSVDGFDNALMSLGKLYFDLNKEVARRLDDDNLGYDILKAYEVGKSTTAKRLIYFLLKVALDFHKQDTTVFKWDNCLFCGAEVYPYHNKCNNCNTEFKYFYEVDEALDKILIEIAQKMNSDDSNELRTLQKSIGKFLNNPHVKMIETGDGSNEEYKHKIDGVRYQYDNIEDQFLTVDLEKFEATSIDLEKFELYKATKRQIASHEKELLKLKKQIESLNIKETSSIYERVMMLLLTIEQGLQTILETDKLKQVKRDLSKIEKKINKQLKIANKKGGYKASQEDTVFHLSTEFNTVMRSIDTTKLEQITNKEYLEYVNGISDIFDMIETLKNQKRENEQHLEVMEYRSVVRTFVEDTIKAVKDATYNEESKLETVENARRKWENLLEKGNLVLSGVTPLEGIENLKTYDEILDQVKKVETHISNIKDQIEYVKNVIEKIKYYNRKKEIETIIEKARKNYKEIQDNVFFVHEFEESESRKRLKKRLDAYNKILDTLSLLKKEMKMLSDGIELNDFDEQKNTSKEHFDTFEMEYNRIYEERELVRDTYKEKSKKIKRTRTIMLVVTTLIVVGAGVGYVMLYM